MAESKTQTETQFEGEQRVRRKADGTAGTVVGRRTLDRRTQYLIRGEQGGWATHEWLGAESIEAAE